MSKRYVHPSVLGGAQIIDPRSRSGAILLADDEVPVLIAELQDYMSRRARELSKAGRG